MAAGHDLRRLCDRQALRLQSFRQCGREAHSVWLDARRPYLEQLSERGIGSGDTGPVIVARLEAARVGQRPVACSFGFRIVPFAALDTVTADISWTQAAYPIPAHVEKT